MFVYVTIFHLIFMDFHCSSTDSHTGQKKEQRQMVFLRQLLMGKWANYTWWLSDWYTHLSLSRARRHTPTHTHTHTRTHTGHRRKVQRFVFLQFITKISVVCVKLTGCMCVTLGKSCWRDSDRQSCCWCSVKTNSAHGAHGAVLAAPVGEVVVITLL